ncbi:hypothetical protein L1887_05584 [Cichorium endivia]|nr:hypothetical protein L1887_05584 [Cichorium endivia]
MAPFFFFLLAIFSFADGGSIGVNYGRIANNLPIPQRNVADTSSETFLLQVKPMIVTRKRRQDMKVNKIQRKSWHCKRGVCRLGAINLPEQSRIVAMRDYQIP